jgi:hypothetical protein
VRLRNSAREVNEMEDYDYDDGRWDDDPSPYAGTYAEDDCRFDHLDWD